MGAAKHYTTVNTNDPTMFRVQQEVGRAVASLDKLASMPAGDVRVIVGGEQILATDPVVAFYGVVAAAALLPAAAGNGARIGQVLTVVNFGTATLSLKAAAAETVASAASLAVVARQAVILQSDGLNAWSVVGSTPVSIVGAGTVTVSSSGLTTTVTGAPDGRDWSSYKHATGGSGLTAHYIAGCNNSAALTTGAPALNTLFALPFIAPQRGGTADLIDFEVTTLAAGNARVGLYNNVADNNLYPNLLLADGGSVSVNTTGVKSTVINVALNGGQLYWLAWVGGTAAATLRCLNLANMPHILGVSAAGSAAPNVGIQVAFTFGALPSTFTASGSYLTTVPVPVLRLRIS